jgi:ABC-type antimicrobial peptide transport system permease subunit
VSSQQSRSASARSGFARRYARPADIVLLVARQGVIAAAATALGLGLAYGAARLLSGFLFGVGAHDPVSFVVVGVVVLAVSAIACIVPARRAARVDPLSALRSG